MDNLFPSLAGISDNVHFCCPFCGFNGPLELMGADRFPVLRELQVIGAGRRAARCPKCKSSDKERLIFTYLRDVKKLDSSNSIITLHIAPEGNLQSWLKSISAKYIAGDAFLQNQKFDDDVQFVDIRHTFFFDSQFDCIICNHVICDIKEDREALREIYRILKSGGEAILQVPITKVSKTVVNPNAITKIQKEKAYGYGYHERIYNNIDYLELLSSIGFVVDVINISARYSNNGINPLEDIYVCKKCSK